MSDIKTPAQELLNWAIVRGASRMIPEGTDASAVTAEQIGLVMDRAILFIEKEKRTKKEIAKALGFSAGVISEFLAGKYAGDKSQVAIDLDRWLNTEEELASRPATATFVETSVFRRMLNTAMYCLEGSKEKRTIGLVYGPLTSGMGKTVALQHIHRLLGPRRSALITLNKVDANPTGLLRKLCLGLHIGHEGSNAQRFTRICDKVRGRSFIFLIDEIHNLRWSKGDKPFYYLKDLYNETGTAQLWTGTADLVTYLNRSAERNMDESLAQIRSRIFPFVNLAVAAGTGGSGDPDLIYDVDDIRKMFAKNSLRIVGDAPRLLCQIANQPDSGSLRTCVNLVEYATAIGLMEGWKNIDETKIRAAMRSGFRPGDDDLLIHGIEDRIQSRRAAKVG